MNLRAFIEHARQAGDLVEIKQSVDPYLEMAGLIHALDGRPVLFHDVLRPGVRAAAGIYSRREYFTRALELTPAELLPRLTTVLGCPTPPPVVQEAPCHHVVNHAPDLNTLPILTHLPHDGGPYLSASIVAANDPDHGRNLSYHRMMVTGPRHMVARVVENRGLHTAWRRTTEDLPIAILLGSSAAVALAASMAPPPDVDELAIAHALDPTPTVRCITNEIEVPADTEIVLEGRLTHTLAPEGPFLDLTETPDPVRRQPVIEIDCITHRANPIYQALLPGKLEHKMLMGMPREPTIFAAVNDVCPCHDVYITPGGTSWLHAVVQITPQGPEDARRAIEAAFLGHGSLKHVVIVDKDIAITDPAEVEWAIATRFQASRDLYVFEDRPGSSLDPSAVHVAGQKSRTAKMGLDATIPWGEPREDFLRAPYPKVDLHTYGLGRP